MIRREFLLNVLLASGSVLSLAVVFELALRIVGYNPMGQFLDREMGIESLLVLQPSQHPELRYELAPAARGHAFQADIETNSHGFRDREWEPAGEDAYRVVVLGDSITFGNYMRAEDRFSDLLRGSLAASLAGPVEVMNLGVVGYDTLQEVVTLERHASSLSPDLVVLTYCVNDVGVASFDERYLHDAPAVDSPLYRLRLAQYLRNKLDTLALSIRFRTANGELQFAADNGRYVVPVDGDRTLMALVEELKPHLGAEPGWFGKPTATVARWYASPARLGKLDYALARLARLKEQVGFEVLVLLVPYLEPTPAFQVIYRIVEHEAGKHGLAFVSLEPEFDAYGTARLRFPQRPDDKTHPNEAGHRLIAKKLQSFVGSAPERVAKRRDPTVPGGHASTAEPRLSDPASPGP